MGSTQLYDPAISDQELMKTLDLTSGAELIQEEIDKAIADALNTNNALRQNLFRKTNQQGTKYILNRRTARGTARAVADTDARGTEQNSTYSQVEFAYKTIIYEGGVTRRLQAAGKAYGDALQEEIQNGIQAIKDQEDDWLITGDSSSDAKEFDGLAKILSDESREKALGGDLTLEDLDEAIDNITNGTPNMMVMSRRTRRQLRALLQEQQRFINTIEVKGGFMVESYDNIPIYVDRFVSDDEDGDASNKSSIYIFETSPEGVFVGEQTAVRLERLAKTTSQKDSFDIYEDLTLVLKDTLRAWRLKGITKT